MEVENKNKAAISQHPYLALKEEPVDPKEWRKRDLQTISTIWERRITEADAAADRRKVHARKASRPKSSSPSTDRGSIPNEKSVSKSPSEHGKAQREHVPSKADPANNITKAVRDNFEDDYTRRVNHRVLIQRWEERIAAAEIPKPKGWKRMSLSRKTLWKLRWEQ